ncbi:hypothetical protein QPK87_15530 [Kamptonema cortianum]|nr:hypothetical protein [Kamptonema cortianum]
MLKDIRSEISTLSLKFDLQQRYLRELKDNHTTIVKMRQDLRQSIRRYQKESMDVERLQRLSIRSLILSLAGKKKRTVETGNCRDACGKVRTRPDQQGIEDI